MRLSILALACLTLCGALAVVNAETKPADKDTVLRHVVLFKFKDDLTESQVSEVVEAFGKLPTRIDAITDFEWGTDVSVENKAEGFTHCFVVTFRDAKGRDEYLPHPAHKEFVALVGPRIDKVLVVDFVAQK